MNLSELSTAQIAIIIAVAAVLVIAGIGVWLSVRKRRTERLRTQFGGAEYTRAVEVGGRRQAEAALDERAQRVQGLHIQPLAAGDRARFLESWRVVQSRFVDGPGAAVIEADRLLGDVMSTRGYPVSDFEQRAADISVNYPLVLDNYRSAHKIALRQAQGEASTEELRQAMIHYRTLFDELVGQPEMARAKAAS